MKDEDEFMELIFKMIYKTHKWKIVFLLVAWYLLLAVIIVGIRNL